MNCFKREIPIRHTWAIFLSANLNLGLIKDIGKTSLVNISPSHDYGIVNECMYGLIIHVNTFIGVFLNNWKRRLAKIQYGRHCSFMKYVIFRQNQLYISAKTHHSM